MHADGRLGRLRSARVRRESYVGPWLPEPVVQEGEPAMDRRTEMAESVSMAFMLVLEALSPVERFRGRWEDAAALEAACVGQYARRYTR